MTADDLIGQVKFDDRGLVPVVTQDVSDNVVLMVAWANAEAIRSTFTGGRDLLEPFQEVPVGEGGNVGSFPGRGGDPLRLRRRHTAVPCPAEGSRVPHGGTNVLLSQRIPARGEIE